MRRRRCRRALEPRAREGADERAAAEREERGSEDETAGDLHEES
jgi:hypothetical protein